MKKKLMVIVPVIVLLLGLVAVKMIVLKPAPPDERKLAAQPGQTYTLSEPFVVNLADGSSSPHFAKVGIAMRFSKWSDRAIIPGKADRPATTASDPELRDIVIATLSGKTSRQLQTAAGRDDVKRAIVQKVNKQTDLKILDVYYTEFAVQ